jgi:rhodanese-related sulfurtransferase
MHHKDTFIRFANAARRRIIEITPRELTKKKSLPVIIEVRERDEFLQGHIGGAKHISRGLLEERIGQVAPDLTTPILVYCSQGNRSALAADTLQNMGYQNVSSLMGGLEQWLESGGVVECAGPIRRRDSFNYQFANLLL